MALPVRARGIAGTTYQHCTQVLCCSPICSSHLSYPHEQSSCGLWTALQKQAIQLQMQFYKSAI